MMQNAAKKENATSADLVNEFENQLSGYIRIRREKLFSKYFTTPEQRHRELLPETRAALNELKVLEEALFGTKL